MESNLDLLSRDTAYLVLTKLKPHDVLNMCYSTTKNFEQYCKDQILFTNLMRVHYPNSILTANPREQYESITNGYLTTYSFDYDLLNAEVLGELVKIGDTQLPKDTPGWSLGNLNPYLLKNFYETNEIKNYMKNQSMVDEYDNSGGYFWKSNLSK